ncbi:iron-sulfur cluster biosynthesis family protein [Paenibacillus koleovorans]|uniref:iron-sulfur cluster biosynthesis family protein n=1 Tax=Paenibacillus koleovorans TaxID=121608 RepID=UPI000FD77C82|nr:iron-sulfur cluster biosynthesis family protein [Paenibacillus koleovorans]
MQITVTPAAVNQLQLHLDAAPHGPPARVKLAYDAEGCGCAVDGVAQLWLVDGAGPDDAEAEGSRFRILYSLKHEVFFDEALTLDYNPDRRIFSLKSKQQFYNSMMSLVDRRA